MSTSGSSDFTRSRNQIISRAARQINAIRAGSTLKAQEVSDWSEALNAMVKRWQATGIHVWTTTEATLFPQASQSRYALALTGADHATQSYTATTLSSAAASGATSLSVASITGISSGDNIGVVLSGGTLYWTTVNGAPSGSTVTLTAGLTGAASSGNTVFAYTTKIVRPLKIVDARRYNIASGLETPISEYDGGLMARHDYQALPNKAQTGTINRAFYDPQLSTGYLYLWSPPATVTDLVKFTWHRPIQDFDSASDNPDLPQEWIDPLVFNLAVVMAPEYQVPTETFNMVASMAQTFLDAVGGYDREAESVTFGVDFN